MPLIRMPMIEALERKIPGVRFPLGPTSSRLGLVRFSFLYFVSFSGNVQLFDEKGKVIGI